MKRTLLLAFMLTAVALACAAPAFAADGSNAYDTGAMAAIGAGIAIGLTCGLCGLGQGRGLAAACEGTARNPGAGDQIFKTAIVGLALIESLGIYSLVIAFLLYTRTAVE